MRSVPLALIVTLWIGPVSALAEDVAPALAVGDTVPAIALDDQFGERQEVDATVRLLALSRDMDGGTFLREAMEGRSAEWLAARGVVSLADIHGMPRLVARMFAIPAMRKYPYPLLLDRDGEASKSLPSEEGRATLLALDGLRILSVDHVDSADAVRAALEALPADAVPTTPSDSSEGDG